MAGVCKYEQDIENSSRNATSIGGETPIGGLGRLYARRWFDQSVSYLDDTDERQRTVVTLTSIIWKTVKCIANTACVTRSVREAEAAIGLKNKWYVQEGLTLNTLLERVESLGEKNNTATAAGFGVEHLAKETQHQDVLRNVGARQATLALGNRYCLSLYRWDYLIAKDTILYRL